MAEKFLGVVAEFDEAAMAEFERIQTALRAAGCKGRQSPDLPHHVTMGLFERERYDDVVAACERVSRAGRFRVDFDHIGLFGMDVLFLAPEESHEMLRAREAFEPYARPEPYRWTPHLTLLIDDPAEVHRAIPIVAAHFTGVRATMTRLRLYAFWPSNLLREFPLA